MKVHPIKFNPAMAAEVCAGTKTVTRRIMDMQPCEQPVLVPNGGDSYWSNRLLIQGAHMGSQNQGCPYGRVGDHLEVIEPKGLKVTLEVTDVRVEQIQMITLGEIVKEGLARSVYEFVPVQTGFDVFQDVWDSIYGAGSWAANPWVWVVEFKRVTP